MTTATPVAESGNQNIDALTVTLQWDADSVTFGVPTDVSQYGDYAYSYERGGTTYEADETVGFVAPDAAFIEAVRDAMAMIASYTQLELVELAADPGDAVIRAGITTTPKPTGVNAAAYAVGPKYDDDPLYHIAGDTWFDPGGAAELGTVRYTIVLHEQGHSVGLNDVNVLRDDGTLAKPMEAEFRSTEFSIMSYAGFIGATGNGFTVSSGHAPQSFMMWDIATLQFMYGANFSTNAGNTVYSFDPATGETLIDGVSQGAPTANVIFRTIWDGNGTDTYDFSAYTTDLSVDLAPGGWSDVDVGSHFQAANLNGGPNDGYARGQVANAMLYQGDTRSLIENAIGGSGDDSIRGNEANNLLEGGSGNDTLQGFNGNDTLVAGNGADLLDGGSGHDLLLAGPGAEQFLGGSGDDTVSYAGATGSLSINLGTGIGMYTNASGDTYDSVENAIGGSSHDSLTGSGVANRLEGGDGDDSLYGMGGNDTLVSGNGGGTLDGGSGADVLIAGSGAESIIGGSGTDLVSYAGAGGAVVVNLGSGTGAFGWAQGDSYSGVENASGSAHGDTITGSGAANVLNGLDGHDLLSGAAAADLLSGGEGDDTLIGGSDADGIIGGGGFDTARFATAMTLNLTTGVHTGEAAGDVFASIERFEGSQFDDTMTGSGAAEVLEGRGGDDDLYGMGGDDTLRQGEGGGTLDGGSGNDWLHAGSGADVVIGGADQDWVSYLGAAGGGVIVNLGTGTGALGWAQGDTYAGVENAAGSNAADILTGNNAGNGLFGHGGNDQLSGAGGADVLDGGDGDDVLVGGSGGDTILGGNGTDAARYAASVTVNLSSGVHAGEAAGDVYVSIERFEGSNQADTMIGSGTGDIFDGRGGDDSLDGGGGNDTLIGGAGFDTLNGGAGTDTADYTGAGAAVQVNLTLGAAVGSATGGDVLSAIERVHGSAFGDVIRGDAMANLLSGLGGNDSLIGEDGADTLNGGAGNDTLVGDVGDSIIGGAGTDVLRFAGAPVTVNMATGVHGGGAAGATISGIERIEGTSGGDILVAGNAALVLDGRDGADNLHGGTRADTLLGGAGNDSLEGLGGSDVLRGGAGTDTVVGGSHGDVFLWRSGDLGTDLIVGFNLAEDRLAFGTGFLASPVLGGTGALSEMLDAQLGLGGTVLLVAHTAEAGWQTLARLGGVSLRDLDTAIADGSILATAPAGGWDAIG